MARRASRGKGCRSRTLLVVLLLVVLGIGALIALAPSIAGPMVKGQVVAAVDRAIPGSVSIGSIRLGWFGPVRAQGVKLLDPAGQQVLVADVSVDKGLLGLALGYAGGVVDVGTVEASGTLDIVYDRAGSSNLDRALGAGGSAQGAGKQAKPQTPSKPAATAEIELPVAVRGVVKLSTIDATVTRELASGARTVSKATLSGDIKAQDSGSSVALKATLMQDGKGAGSISIDGSSQDLVRGKVLRPMSATIDGSLKLEGVAAGFADGVAGLDGLVLAALGSTLDASVVVSGSATGGKAEVVFAAPLAQMDAKFERSGEALTLSAPARASVQSRDVVAWLERVSGKPLIDPALAQVPEFPSIALRLDTLRIPLAAAGAKLALGSARLDATVELDAFELVAKGAGAANNTYSVAPLTIRALADDLGKGLSVVGGTEIKAGANHAGSLRVDVSAPSVVDAAGALRSVLEWGTSGRLTLDGLDTRAVEPFLTPHGLRAEREIGPRLGMAVSIEAPARDKPSLVRASVTSDNVQARIDALIDGLASATSDASAPISLRVDEASFVRIARAGPAAGAFLKDAGVVIEGEVPIEVRLSAQGVEFASGPGGARQLRMGDASGQVLVRVGGVGTTLPAVKADGTPEASQRVPVALAETRATIGTERLSQGVRIGVTGGATIDGSPNADAKADVLVRGLVAADGSLRAMDQASVEGEISLVRLRLDHLQRLVGADAMGFARGFGDRVDARVTLAPLADQKPALGVGATSATIDVVGMMGGQARGSVKGQLRLAGDTVKLGEGGLVLAGYSLPPPALEMLRERAGMDVVGPGEQRVVVRSLSLPLKEQGLQAMLSKATVDAQVQCIAFAATTREPGVASPDPVQVRDLTLDVKVATGTLRAQVAGAMGHGQRDFDLAASVDWPRAFAPDRSMLSSPIGPWRVRLNNAPLTLATLAPAASDTARADMLQTLRDALGGPISAEISSTPPSGPGPGALAGRISSEHLAITIASAITDQAYEGLRVEGTHRAHPKLVQRLTASRPATAPTIELREPVTLRLTTDPARIARTAMGLPDAATLGQLALQFTSSDIGLRITSTVPPAMPAAGAASPGPVPVALKAEDVTIRALKLGAVAPVAAIVSGSSTQVSVEASAQIVGSGAGAAAGTLSAKASASIAGGKPVGPVLAQVDVSSLPASLVDGVLGVLQPQSTLSVATLAGPSVSLTVSAEGSMALVPPPTAQGPVSESEKVPSLVELASTATISSERLRSEQPIRAKLGATTIELTAPSLRWRATPEAMAMFVPPSSKVGLAEAGDVSVAVRSLTLSRPRPSGVPGMDVGPMERKTFQANVEVVSPALVWRALRAQPDGRFVPTEAALLRLTDISLRTYSLPDGRIEARGEALIDGKPATAEGLKGFGFWAEVTSLSTELGAITPDKARANADVNLRNAPTSFVGAVIGQERVVVESLGEGVWATIKARGVGQGTGTVEAELATPKAKANLAGNLGQGVFTTSQPIVVSLKEISPALTESLFRGAPFIGSFTKRPTDEPASLTITGLRYPLDGNLRNLDARIAFDPGTAEVALGSVLGGLLSKEIAGSLATGPAAIGQKLDPMSFVVSKGVASYDRYTLRIGEFAFASSGSVDLADRTLNLTSFVPLGALATESVRGLSGSLDPGVASALGTIDKLTPMPLKVTGSFDKAQVKIDPQMLIKELGNTLLDPNKLLQGGLKDLLGGG